MSGKFSKAGAVLAATGAALGAFVITAPAAQADIRDCPASQVCAWQHPDFVGYMGHAVGSDPNWNNKIENKDSSWFNNGVGYPSAVRIFTKHKYTGDYWCMEAGYYDNYDDDVSDKGSSHKWVPSC